MTKLMDRKETLILELEEKFFEGQAIEDEIANRLRKMTESELMLIHRIVAKAVSVTKRKE